jgi:PleD family two-component response regulator
MCQEAFHPSSTLEPQPSTSTAQIEPEQQEQMETDDINPNFQTFTQSMEYQFTSPLFTTSLDNECITSQTFTPLMHSEFRQEQEEQQEEYIRPKMYLQIYNKATVLRLIL